MADVRTLLAAVLGVGLGLAFVLAPDAVIRTQTAGRLPDDRGGDYGEGSGAPDHWRRLVQALGVGAILAGAYFGAVALGVV